MTLAVLRSTPRRSLASLSAPLCCLLLCLLALAGFSALLESVIPVNSAFDVRVAYVHFLYRLGRQISETELRVARRVLCRIFKSLVEVNVDMIENANGKLPLTYYRGACKLPLRNLKPIPLRRLLVLWVTRCSFTVLIITVSPLQLCLDRVLRHGRDKTG